MGGASGDYRDMNLRPWRGLAKAEAEKVWPAAIAAARFLAMTGWRRGEVLGLTWSAIDLERRTATLADSEVRP